MKKKKQVYDGNVFQYLTYMMPYISSLVYAIKLTSVSESQHLILALAFCFILGASMHIMAYIISKVTAIISDILHEGWDKTLLYEDNITVEEVIWAEEVIPSWILIHIIISIIGLLIIFIL